MSDRKNIYSNRYGETNSWGIGCVKTMLVWDGSVIKLIWLELLAFLVLYFTLSILYRTIFIHDEAQREYFELLCIFSSRFSNQIPVTFMTGFYVANVVTRYWNQFVSLAWPDRIIFRIVGFIPGQDEYSRTLRRTLTRYCNLSILLVYRLVSNKVEERFPTYDSLVDAGLMLPDEAKLLADIDNRTPYDTTWAPILWIVHLLQKERFSGRLKMEPPLYANLISSIDYLESCNRSILNYAWVNIPLAYTQVANLAVYSYLFSSIFAKQFLEPRGASLDSVTFKSINVTTSEKTSFYSHTPVVYIPVFSILEFICYLGWIKMAEALLNPWGDDDDDFQISFLIDRNFQTSYLIVDEALPDLEVVPDMFQRTNQAVPTELIAPNVVPITNRPKDNKSRLDSFSTRISVLSHPVSKISRVITRKSRSSRSSSRNNILASSSVSHGKDSLATTPENNFGKSRNPGKGHPSSGSDFNFHSLDEDGEFREQTDYCTIAYL